MSSSNLHFEIKDGYTLLQPKVLGPEELDRLPSQVEDLLLQKKQDVVLSLRFVDTVFSSHLTAFVQIYRLMQSFNLRLIVADISPSVLNVMQMTQLDSLLPIHLSLQDFEESFASRSASNSGARQLKFSYEVKEQSGMILAICKGYMSFGAESRALQTELAGKQSIRFDFSEVGYMDTRVLIMMADLATRAHIEVVGASNVIRELFEQHRIHSKVTFLD